MRKEKILWITVIVVSVILLIGYCFSAAVFSRSGYYNTYERRYYGAGMMGRGFNQGRQQFDSGEKLSIDAIKNAVDDYIKGYGEDLQISDIIEFKDTDYYVSVEEKDTGKGAMELMANPYTGQVYPEYGPNMMWNDKYRISGAYGMMGNRRGRMMGGAGWYDYNKYDDNKSPVGRILMEPAAKIADKYLKNNLGKGFSVQGEGNEFYGYYTFYITRGSSTVGMVSVNYYTGDVWYHKWNGEVEKIISKK